MSILALSISIAIVMINFITHMTVLFGMIGVVIGQYLRITLPRLRIKDISHAPNAIRHRTNEMRKKQKGNI